MRRHTAFFLLLMDRPYFVRYFADRLSTCKATASRQPCNLTGIPWQLKGMFQTPGPYVRMQFSPLTRLRRIFLCRKVFFPPLYVCSTKIDYFSSRPNGCRKVSRSTITDQWLGCPIVLGQKESIHRCEVLGMCDICDARNGGVVELEGINRYISCGELSTPTQ